MYCTSCGFAINEANNFCPKCGVPLGGKNAAPARPAGQQKRLARPMLEKRVGGVCAGFARYLDVDLTLMRIIWLCTAVFTGVGFIAYVICWIVMPADWNEPAQAAAAAGMSDSRFPAEAPREQTGSSTA